MSADETTRHAGEPRRSLFAGLFGGVSAEKHAEVLRERDALLAEKMGQLEIIEKQVAHLHGLTVSLEKASAEHEELVKERDALNAAKAAAEESSRTIEALREQLKDATAQHWALVHERDTVLAAKAAAEQSNRTVEALDGQLKEAGAQNLRLVQERDTLLAEKEAAEKAKKTLAVLQAEVRHLETRKSNIHQSLDTLCRTLGVASGYPVAVGGLQPRIRVLRAQIDSLKRQKDLLRREHAQVSRRACSVEKNLAKNTAAHDELKKHSRKLQDEIESQKSGLKELQAQLVLQKQYLAEENKRELAAIAERKRVEEARMPQERLAALDAREQQVGVLHAEAVKKAQKAKECLASARIEADAQRDKAKRVLQRARAKADKLLADAESERLAAVAERREVARERSSLRRDYKAAPELTQENKKLKESVAKLKKEARDSSKQASSPAFGREGAGELFSGLSAFQSWVVGLGGSGRQEGWSRQVVTLGDGPFPKELLDEALRRRNHVPCAAGTAGSEIMIVGRTKCSLSHVVRHIKSREGKKLRIYSQEMAVLALITGSDPFDADGSALMEMGRTHPILARLIEGVDYEGTWPFTVSPEKEKFDQAQEIIELRDGKSPLLVMGYHTGKEHGLSAQQRRKVLRAAFEGEIPNAVTGIRNLKAYMAQWGRPRTSQRLWRMAHHLRDQCNLKCPNPTMERPVREWREDLGWLKSELYPHVRFKFRWPGTSD